MAQQRHTILITDPDMDARMRLKQASSTVQMFGKVLNSSTLGEAKHILEKDEKIDIVFMSYRFDQSALSTFIREARETKQGKYAVLIIMLPSTNEGAASVIRNILVGLDGVLVEPFSVKNLVELSLLAAELSKKRDDERNREAMKLLVSQIVDKISSIAQLRAQNLPFNDHVRKLKEMCHIVRALDEHERNRYFEILIDYCAELSSNAPPGSPRYNGASSRIRRKLEERLMAELNSVN